MGWAEKLNQNSEWNRKRAGNIAFSAQTTQKQNVTQVSTPTKDEPTVIQITPKSIFMLFKEFLCRMLKLAPSKSTNLGPTY